MTWMLLHLLMTPAQLSIAKPNRREVEGPRAVSLCSSVAFTWSFDLSEPLGLSKENRNRTGRVLIELQERSGLHRAWEQQNPHIAANLISMSAGVFMN